MTTAHLDAAHRARTAPADTTDRMPPQGLPSGRRLLHRRYVATLAWACALFNTVRLLSYLPTMVAIHASGDSSQHSLWTWFTWLGANLTMAAWLYEQQGQRASGPMWVSCGNSVMCAATLATILAYRF